MNCNKKVSVIIPVYNSECYLSRCIDSVLDQTYQNVEIICIDDGSTDGSPYLLDEYVNCYPGKVIVEHRSNSGAAAARNRGLELVTGDFLTFLDNDDWLDSDFIETLLYAALESKSQVVCSGYRRPNSDQKIISESIPRPSDEWGKYLVEAAWAKLYSTSFVLENHFTFLNTNIDEDLYFSLPAVEIASNVTILSYCGYNWYYNESSVSNTKQRKSSGLLFEQTLDALLEMLDTRDIFISAILQHYFIRLIVWFLLYTRSGDGARHAVDNFLHYRTWLDNNLTLWRSDCFASPLHPVGDAILNRIAVWLFVKHPLLFRVALFLY